MIGKKLGLLFFLCTGFLGGHLWSMDDDWQKSAQASLRAGQARAMTYECGPESVRQKIKREDEIRAGRQRLWELKVGRTSQVYFQDGCYEKSNWQDLERAINEQEQSYWQQEVRCRCLEDESRRARGAGPQRPTRPSHVPVMTEHEKKICSLKQEIEVLENEILSGGVCAASGFKSRFHNRDHHLHIGYLKIVLEKLQQQHY